MREETEREERQRAKIDIESDRQIDMRERRDREKYERHIE